MYVGLDLGTSGLKGLAIREDQTVVATATAPLCISRPGTVGRSRTRRTGSTQLYLLQLTANGVFSTVENDPWKASRAKKP